MWNLNDHRPPYATIHPSRDYSFSFTRVGGGKARFTIHKTTRWIELSERCGSCQSVPGSVRAPTARICIIPFTSTILIGGLFQSLSPRIFALLLLSFLHTPLPPSSPNGGFVRPIHFLLLSFFLRRSLLWISLIPCTHLDSSFSSCVYILAYTFRVVHYSFSWLVGNGGLSWICLCVCSWLYFSFFFLYVCLWSLLDDYHLVVSHLLFWFSIWFSFFVFFSLVVRLLSSFHFPFIRFFFVFFVLLPLQSFIFSLLSSRF